MISFRVSTSNGALNGIIRTLWNNQREVYSTLIKVIYSDTAQDYYNKAENLLDWNTENNQRYWSTSTGDEHWVGFEFLKGFVSLTDYSIRTTTDNSGSISAPKEWSLIGSLDGTNWNKLDYQNTEETSNPPETFTYKTSKIGFIKFIKFVQKQNHYNYIYKGSLAINKLELFGIYSYNLPVNTCRIPLLSRHLIVLAFISISC